MSEENLPDSEAKKSEVVDSWMAQGKRNEERQDIALEMHRRYVEQRERSEERKVQERIANALEKIAEKL